MGLREAEKAVPARKLGLSKAATAWRSATIDSRDTVNLDPFANPIWQGLAKIAVICTLVNGYEQKTRRVVDETRRARGWMVLTFNVGDVNAVARIGCVDGIIRLR